MTAPVYQKTRLPNGIRVVTERHPSSRAVSVGIWIEKGTRDEAARLAGVSHFVEHLVFKRTQSRTAFQIARAMEAVGGELNAFTGREYTCFVTHALKEHLALSIDVLSDLVCRAKFDPSDFEKEKQVVIQEIHMAEDQLEEQVFDLYFEKAFESSALGRPILGTEASISGLELADVRDHWRRAYVPEQIIVSAAGCLEHQEVVDLVAKLLRPKGKPAGAPRARFTPRVKPKLKPIRVVYPKQAEQTHALMGLPAASFRDPLRFEAFVVNTLLGGGMTSKLYQRIREERGLAYSVYSHLSTFTDGGLKLIYAGCEAKDARKVFELTVRELEKIRSKGISRSDLKLYKTQVTGQILLGSDDVENRMNSLGINEMVFGRPRSPDDVLRDVEAVTVESVNAYLEKYVDPEKMGLFLMGAIRKEDAGWLAEMGTVGMEPTARSAGRSSH